MLLRMSEEPDDFEGKWPQWPSEENAMTAKWKMVPMEPTDEQSGTLARDIVMWMFMTPPTGAWLYRHLRALGHPIPAWLPHMIPEIDVVPPKGAIAAAIYRAMLDAAPAAPVLKAPLSMDGKQAHHCPEKLKPGGCTLHNLHCRYPECDRPPTPERERRAPARREEMAAFAAELKADPAKAQRFFHEAGILDASGNLTPQYGGPAPDAPQQAEPVAQIGWADEFGNLFPMGAWKPTQRTHHDSHKTAWRPVFAHPPCAEAEVARLRAALEEVLVYGNGAKGFIADSVRKIAQRALRGE